MKTESRSGHCVPQAQALRLERLAYGGMSYLVGLVLAAVICWLGYIELRVLLTYLGMIVALKLLYFALVRTNLNLRLADPNMTLVQICTAIALGYYVMFYARQASAPFLLLGVSAAMYGRHQFHRRDFIAMTAAICTGYAMLIVLLHLDRPHQLNLQIDILQLGAFTACMPQFCAFPPWIRRCA